MDGSKFTTVDFRKIERVCGNFQLKSFEKGGKMVGAGGFGAVFSASLGKKVVAIKLLRTYAVGAAGAPIPMPITMTI